MIYKTYKTDNRLRSLFKSNDIIFNIRLFCLVLFAFFLAINQNISTILLFLSAVLSLVKIKNIDLEYLKKTSPLFLLYFLYAVAYYRDDFNLTLYIFERKAVLLVIPLIFSTIKLKDEYIREILKFFVLGCIINYILSLIIAIYGSISFNPFSFSVLIQNTEGEYLSKSISSLLNNKFLGINFSYNMNGTVLSSYYCLAIYIINTNQNIFNVLKRRIFTILLIIGISQFFGMMAFFSLFFVFISLKAFKKKNILNYIIYLVFAMSLLLLASKKHFKPYSSLETKIENIDSRMIIWPTAIKCIKENILFGKGIKKAQRYLESQYPKTGEFGFVSQLKKIDAHNVYLQALLELGIFGLIFIMLIIRNFYKQISSIGSQFYRKIASVFIGLIMIIFLTESILNIYAGISYFIFFYSLFYYISLNNNCNVKI